MSDLGGTHLERTASSPRDSVTAVGTVTQIKDLSQTVKRITISVPDTRFMFKAGQWVDFTIPDVETVGGFSMCSSPGKLQKDRVLDLAVKRSDHPPANWVHTKCRVASKVTLKVGGDFFYEPSAENPDHILLVAGGVGVNPLFSIIQQLCESFGDKMLGNDTTEVCLLYSASSADELIFKNELAKMTCIYPNVKCHFFVTQNSVCPALNHQFEIQPGRISHGALHDAIKNLHVERSLAYLCGPKHMISFLTTTLLHFGFSKKNIRKEEWW